MCTCDLRDALRDLFGTMCPEVIEDPVKVVEDLRGELDPGHVCCS